MQQTIKALWNGALSPCAHCGEQSAEVYDLRELIDRNRENLCKGMTDAQKEVLKNYDACWDEYLYLMTEAAFCDGFSFGSRLTAEALV